MMEKLPVLVRETPSKIVLLLIDGLGGLPHPGSGRTELESARKPNLDALAEKSTLGLLEPVGPGLTPGSAPGHLALFGYDPIKYEVGRGVLEALGIDFELLPGDVAARGNFCTLDEKGNIRDRRAGRLSTEENARLCQKLSTIALEGVQLFVLPVKEHRFGVVFRGSGLQSELSDSDPQKDGLAPVEVKPLAAGARATARLANRFIAQARALLRGEKTANMVLLRGFSHVPGLPSMSELFRLRPAAIASYPVYRGLAKLVGMAVLPTGPGLEDALNTLAQNWARYDFFFVHVKEADMAGEDGDFDRKVRVIEEVDGQLPRVLALKPDVLVVTGDHSTPALLKGHSWHPVPFLLYSSTCRPDGIAEFGERACGRGALGLFPSLHVLPLALAHAGKLVKYGA
jgi:2,3-bisphosphoglycerate-independent phosphoglycerate mutase